MRRLWQEINSSIDTKTIFCIFSLIGLCNFVMLIFILTSQIQMERTFEKRTKQISYKITQTTKKMDNLIATLQNKGVYLQISPLDPTPNDD